MSSPPDGTNLNDYYNKSPDIIIRDKIGRLYNFPRTKYESGYSKATETETKNWYNGWKWKEYPWNDVYEIALEDYTNGFGNNIRPRNTEGDNCIGEKGVSVLNNQGNLPGYDKISGGTYKNNSTPNQNGSTYGYVIADRGVGKDNWAFSVYTKKSLEGFFNDLVGVNKSAFLKLAAKSCVDSDKRKNWVICGSICDGSYYSPSLTTDDAKNCYNGAVKWCLNDISDKRIINSYDEKMSTATAEICKAPLKDGKFDTEISIGCKDSNNIATTFCEDIRKNNGTVSLKKDLNLQLFTKYCNKDDRINTNWCSDVRTICNDTNQLVSDKDPYKCNSLVKGLSNDTNIIAITNKLDLRNVPSGINKSDLLNSFNEASTDAVEDALCALTQNSSDGACKTWNGIRSSEKKLQTIRTAIDKSIKEGGKLTQDVIDYITKDYITLQKFRGSDKYPNSNILGTELTSFCELSDSNLATNLCKNIYNNTSYKDDKIIKDSLDRINDYAFCIATNAFMGKSTIPNDPYNTSCVVRRDKPETFARFLPLAIKYCETGDNIVTPECTKYYNDAPKNINELMRINYLNAKANFTNKETFKDGYGDDCEDDIDHIKQSYIFLFIILICFMLVLVCINKHVKYAKKYKIVDNM